MLAAECTTDSSYARVSDTCLLRLSKDAPKLPGCAAMPDMRFTVLRRAKVTVLSLCQSELSYNPVCKLPQCFYTERLSNHD